MVWRKWPTLYWVGWLLAFGVWEAIAGFDKKHDIPMLTWFVVRYIPWWVAMPVLLWLPLHFGRRYLSPRYRKWLKQ